MFPVYPYSQAKRDLAINTARHHWENVERKIKGQMSENSKLPVLDLVRDQSV